MIHLNNYYNRIRIHITSKKLFNFLIFNGKNHVFAILELNNISFLIEKEKKQLIALFISLISLIIFSLIDNKIDKIFLFFFIGDLIIIFVDVCLELKKDWKGKKDKK